MKTTFAAILLLFAFSALAAGDRGQGAIVIRAGAPVYAASKGDKVDRKLSRGDAVAVRLFSSRLSSAESTVLYDKVDGRVQVLYFANAEQSGATARGWMDPKDLSRFTLPGACEPSNSLDSPSLQWWDNSRNSPSARWWDLCYREARDKKLDELRAAWTGENAAAKPAR